MQKIRILLILGIWISILSFLGFPYSFKKILFTISGLIVVYISFILYKESKKEKEEKEIFDNFSENYEFKESKEEENKI